MSGLPEITVAGTLTADPQLRYTTEAVPVATFTVAANDRRFDPNTRDYVDHGATFLRCSVWRGMGENAAATLTKGSRVLLTGTLKQREYEASDGQQRTVFEVDVTEVGASLRWAMATLRKATTGQQQPATSPAATPQWADEPPF